MPGCRRGNRGEERLGLARALLRVDDGDGGHVDDVLHVGAALEHVHGATHAEQDRTDGGRAAEVVQHLVGDVAGARFGKTRTFASSLSRLNG